MANILIRTPQGGLYTTVDVRCKPLYQVDNAMCCELSVAVFPPNEFVAVVSGAATFRCISVDRIISVRWLVNSTLLNSANLVNVQEHFSEVFGIGILEFTDIPREYNNTRIGCRVELGGGRILLSRDATLLLLQGEFTL